MLNIDEAIAHARKNYNDIINTTYNKCQDEHLSCEGCATPTCKEIADENLQIAEWLEELKMLRLDSYMIHLPERLLLVENGYNKALNDVESEFLMCDKVHYNLQDILSVLNKVKAGGENDA